MAVTAPQPATTCRLRHRLGADRPGDTAFSPPGGGRVAGADGGAKTQPFERAADRDVQAEQIGECP